MKIIFISTYQGKVERGVENYVSELSKRLAKNHYVEVLTSFWQLFNKQEFTFQKMPGLPKVRPGLKIIYPLNGYWQSLGCRIYSWLTGAKLVLGGHAGIGRDDRWNLYMFPDLFIAFSQKGYEWAKRVNPFVKIVKIPHGVDLNTFNPGVKPKKLDLERPIFITVSHLLPYKRVGESVKAVAGLAKGSLLVLGEGPLEKEIDRLGNELLGTKRYRRLTVSHKEVPSYLTASDVFTLVSGSQEAFGLVYLEALACNLPVVGTDDSLRRELVGNAGLFVLDPKDYQIYAEELRKASEKRWEDISRKQAEKYDWERVIREYLKFFSRLGM